MNKKKFLRYGFWAAAATVAALIFYFSAQTSVDSSAASTGFIHQLLLWLRPDFDQLSPEQQFALLEAIHVPIRKCAHFAIYALLGFCNAGAMYTYALPKPKAAGVALGLTVARALLDEWHQSFVPGRGPQVADVGIDTAGALLGIGLCALAYSIYVRRKNKRK